MAREDTDEAISVMPIDQAPYRIRREHDRRERRNGLIAAAVILGALTLLGWGVYRLFLRD